MIPVFFRWFQPAHILWGDPAASHSRHTLWRRHSQGAAKTLRKPIFSNRQKTRQHYWQVRSQSRSQRDMGVACPVLLIIRRLGAQDWNVEFFPLNVGNVIIFLRRKLLSCSYFCHLWPDQTIARFGKGWFQPNGKIIFKNFQLPIVVNISKFGFPCLNFCKYWYMYLYC